MSIASQITRLNNNIKSIKATKQGIKDAVNNDFEQISNEQIEDYAEKIESTLELYKDYIPSTETNEATEITVNDAMSYSGNKLIIKGNTERTILPEGYKALEYIESTGTQYIDTGYVPNSNTKIDIKFMGLNNTTNVVPLFGGRTTAETETYTTFYKVGSKGRVDYGKYSPSAPTIQFINGKMHTFVKDKEKNYLDGEYLNSNDPMEFSCSYPLYINSINTAGTPSATGLKAKLYYTKIYDNNKLVRDLVPAVKKASKNLWDEQLENGTLNENASPIGSTYQQCKGATASQRVRSVNVIHTNGVATISFNNTKYNLFVLFFDNDALYTGRYEGWKTGTFTVNSPYIGIVIKPISGNISPDADDFNIMINSGSTALPYEPEQVGMYDLSATGKNLFDIESWIVANGSTYTKESDGYSFDTKQSMFSTPYYFSDTDIAVSISGILSNVNSINARIDFLHADGTISAGSVITANNSKRENIYCSGLRLNWSTAGTVKISNLMLNTGSTALPYEAYQKRFYTNAGTGEFVAGEDRHIDVVTGENTITINNTDYPLNLGNIELCKIENYQDEIIKVDNTWKIRNKIIKIDSYNGETITTPYISTTGGLDIGATVYYVGTKDYIITDDVLISQLEALYEHLPTVKGTNHITVTEQNLKPYMQLSYKPLA